MKFKSLLLVAALFLSVHFMSGQSTEKVVINELLSAYSPKNFTTEPVTDQQLDLILKCGIKAPSARNYQPWKFTVVRDEQIMKQLIGDAINGNVLIIVSGQKSAEGNTPDFDCGLATENMFIAATSLGLGARIYGGPVGVANEQHETLKIPDGYKVVMILRVGNIEKNVDGVSSATSRKPMEDIVIYLE